jgi:hypothetical protein
MSNYQQVVSQLGGAAAGKLISPEEAAVIVDELEATAPAIHQHYPDEVALAVRSALTDAELFISYNMPAKALGPLMAALPQAPSDLRLNQRLAALHTRASRFAEAAVCCRTLQSIYSEADHPEDATRYGELADRYQERSSASAIAELPVLEHSASLAESAPQELSVESAPAWPAAEVQPAENEFAVVADAGEESAQSAAVDQPELAASAPESEGTPAEIDLSSEWDDSLTVELDASSEVPEIEITDGVDAADIPAATSDSAEEQPVVAETSAPVAETIEEVRFYVEHGMPEQATAALKKLHTLTNDQSVLSPIEAEVAAAAQAPAEEAPAVEAVSEITIDEPAAEFAVEDPAAEFSVAEAPAAIEELPAVVEEISPEPETAIPAPAAQAAPIGHPERSKVPLSSPAAPPVPAAAPAPGVLQDFVSDLESSLGDSFLPGAVPQQPSAVAHASTEISQPELEPIGNSAPTKFGVKQPEVLGEFVADLESSLGDDFLKGAPVPESQSAPGAPFHAHAEAEIETPVETVAVAAPPQPAPVPPVVAPVIVPAAASAAAASASTSPTISHQASAAIAPPVPGAPKPQRPPSAPPAKSSPFAEDAGVDLAEMFGELKHDLESGSTTTEEDPETHYNLGIAFREMGLLDEAIGELQKTCQAVDRGHPFPQVMQTYTWLAQCFLDKGVPQAAIRWYDKALAAPGVDEETRTALHYELAAAYETAGDKPAALKHFMEVYGRNIDYRDVAERIKPLKS